MKAIVVIVAKEPLPAQVKTRLCPHLSASRAAELYTLFIQDMVDEMSRLRESASDPSSCVSVAIAYTPEESEAAFEAILPVPVPLFPQQGADLGQRLLHVFEKLCGKGYDQVHIINSDSPDMPRSLISESTKLLESPQTDLVLGPCADGGYYLIGLKEPVPELFREIPWSTDRVLEMTLERARTTGLSCALLEPWYDIDTFGDLTLFLERNRERKGDGYAPGWRTLKYLSDKTDIGALG
jgi:hypothetical protein